MKTLKDIKKFIKDHEFICNRIDEIIEEYTGNKHNETRERFYFDGDMVNITYGGTYYGCYDTDEFEVPIRLLHIDNWKEELKKL